MVGLRITCNNPLMKHQTVVRNASQPPPPLEALPVFIAVARLQSFSAAATSLNLDRSRVSRIIAAMEDRLGLPLFSRTTRHTRLTPEGLELLERIAPAMTTLEQAFGHLDRLADTATGSVTLTASPDLARHLVAPLLPGFRQAHPNVRVELVSTEAVLDLTQDGIDLALRLGRPGRLSGVARKLTTLPAAFFASPTYLERRGLPRTLPDLIHHETLWPRPPRDTAAFGADRSAPAASITADFGTLAAIARAGGGIALLPAFIANDDVLGGRLVRVLDAPAPPTPLYLVSRPERPLPPRVTALSRHLVGALTHRT
jgi:DNA-binding transcriptional LysR family regulator